MFTCCQFVYILTANDSPELDGLPSNCQETCKRAIELLDDVCDDVHKGEIKKPRLEVIIKNESLFIKLVRARLPTAVTTRRSTVKALEDAIKQRQLEIQHFLEKRDQLKYLIKRITVKVQGKWVHVNFCVHQTYMWVHGGQRLQATLFAFTSSCLSPKIQVHVNFVN